jgi:F-type H+-transporting ATPase subunit delta
VSISKIAVRYAKALFLAAREQEVLDKVRYDMELLHDISTRQPDIIQLLESPVVNPATKFRVFNSLFSGRVNNMTMDFLKLVTANKREEFIPGMCRQYIHLYKKEMGILQASIGTASRLHDALKKEIISMIRDAFHAKIELEEEVNKDLIGGFVLRIEDKQLDASVKGALNRIKKELQE